jgi:RNA polymerase sigma-70 factor (ECF subfamily)
MRSLGVESLDQSLVAGLRAGDPAAFDRTYLALAPRVYAFLLRMCRRRDLADDLAQETWLRVARHAARLAPDTRLLPWLFTVARNLYRSHQRWLLVDGDFLAFLSGRDRASVDPEALLAASQGQARLEAALAALPEKHREVLLLVGVAELDHADAARVLGLSAENLRQRLSRARRALGERLAEPPVEVPT